MATAANAVDKAGKGVGGDTVAESITDGETCTPVCSETVEISVDNADCQRGTQKLSPASVTSAEKTHTGTLKEHGYDVETATVEPITQENRSKEEEGTGVLLKRFIRRE